MTDFMKKTNSYAEGTLYMRKKYIIINLGYQKFFTESYLSF